MRPFINIINEALVGDDEGLALKGWYHVKTNKWIDVPKGWHHTSFVFSHPDLFDFERIMDQSIDVYLSQFRTPPKYDDDLIEKIIEDGWVRIGLVVNTKVVYSYGYTAKDAQKAARYYFKNVLPPDDVRLVLLNGADENDHFRGLPSEVLKNRLSEEAWQSLIENPVADVYRNVTDIEREPDDLRFTTTDKRFISRKKYPDIVVRKLARVPFDLFIYLVDSHKTSEAIGMISDDQGSNRPYSFYYDLPQQLSELEDMLGEYAVVNMKQHPNAVHLLITHNDAYASGHAVLTPWMILHRLAHACLDVDQKAYLNIPIVATIYRSIDNIERDYGIHARSNRRATIEILHQVFPFKSAKNGAYIYELWMELFTYYCYSGGKITTNSVSPEIDRTTERMKAQLIPLYEKLIKELHGKVWVG